MMEEKYSKFCTQEVSDDIVFFFSNHITPCQEPTCFGNQLTMKNLFREPTGDEELCWERTDDEEPVSGTN